MSYYKILGLITLSCASNVSAAWGETKHYYWKYRHTVSWNWQTERVYHISVT
jgi:hypothetical protein